MLAGAFEEFFALKNVSQRRLVGFFAPKNRSKERSRHLFAAVCHDITGLLHIGRARHSMRAVRLPTQATAGRGLPALAFAYFGYFAVQLPFPKH
jgi:hypothetical protein